MGQEVLRGVVGQQALLPLQDHLPVDHVLGGGRGGGVGSAGDRSRGQAGRGVARGVGGRPVEAEEVGAEARIETMRA